MKTYDEILGKLKKREFSPLYLFMGEEPFFIDRLTDFLEDNVVDAADRDFNQMLVYGNDKNIDGSQIIAAAKEFPFGSQYRLIIIKEAQDLKEFDKLKIYAENPTKTSIVVICYKYGKLRAAQYKPFDKNGVLFLSDKIKDNKLCGWIQNQVTVHHFKINMSAAQLLVESIGNDLTRIDNEIQKLKLFLSPDSEITTSIIEKHIGISKEFNILELQNALGEQNTEKTYKIALNFCKNLKENPNVKTISALYTFYNKMLSNRLAPDNSPETMARIHGNVHPYSVIKSVEYSQRHSIPALIRIISLLREYDLKSKGVDASMDEGELLKELIYKILH